MNTLQDRSLALIPLLLILVTFGVGRTGLAEEVSEQRQRGQSALEISGVYPHLTMRNEDNECGTGAVVLWQGDLWAITYSPHRPAGSSDKLYQITPALEQQIFAGSVGGTPANRMIHRESNQLLIGPYLIDDQKKVRVIPPSSMYGRLTGNARHLVDPANKVYYATMEEGLYSVDVHTLEVECHIRDGNSGAPEVGLVSELLGYHGKGLYSGQGRVVYSNNGESGPVAQGDPTVPSGALGQWFGKGDWELVRRNQFTEVSGPSGITGSEHPASDPIWTLGWDARSLILGLLEEGVWSYYRLPKASHSYDGAHGWNTEWPRIREIGESDLLATMHGTFWRFPVGFSRGNSAGIAPRSNYLKVIGDFCRWQDRIVLGCDDSAKSEFLNTRPFKAKHAAAMQSNSNLWFIDPSRLDQLGPAIGRGSVWLREDTQADQISDSYLFSGYDYRQLHLSHTTEQSVRFALEVDRQGDGRWEPLRTITVKPGEAVSHLFSSEESGAWIRLISSAAARGVTANFQYRNRDQRDSKNDASFAGIATSTAPAATSTAATSNVSAASYALMRSVAYDTLGIVAAAEPSGDAMSYYEMNQAMEIIPVENPVAAKQLVAAVQQPAGAISVDDASVIVVEAGRRYRIPKREGYERVVELPPTTGKTLEEYLPESLAREATVTVSSTLTGYAAKHAVDGIVSDESRWIGESSGQQWIEVDLGMPQTLRSIWIVTGWLNQPQYVAADFDVQMHDGRDWKTIPGGEIRENRLIELEIPLESPVTTQRVRFVAKTSGYMRVYEIGLFDHKLDIAPPPNGFGIARVCREVATERDLLNVHGSFYELPARNAQGLAKLRPIATHDLAIHDFCSHNGLLLFSGIDGETRSEHIFRSSDGRVAVWAGVVDDLWKLGKPRGVGGPWKNTAVKRDQPSDPYLMTAYDEKRLVLLSSADAAIRIEVDVDGTDMWIPYQTFSLHANEAHEHEFPVGFSAYWVRAVSDSDTTATVTFTYE